MRAQRKAGEQLGGDRGGGCERREKALPGGVPAQRDGGERGLREERRRQVGPVGRGRRARVTRLSGERERVNRGAGMRVLLGC